MKERPILFKGEMVRALLSGAKTQTRRIIKPILGPQASWDKWEGEGTYRANGLTGDIPIEGRAMILYCPFSIGMRLWVKETFLHVDDFHGKDVTWYRADHDTFPGQWKPSLFMRREYSRITLEITGVRVERLNDISAHDSFEEGIARPSMPCLGSDVCIRDNARNAYRKLWESINGPRSWELNPHVWVIEFRKL